MNSAFQNRAKFENPTYFGKTLYPKENIDIYKYNYLSDRVLTPKELEIGHPNVLQKLFFQ